jgi:hypothetical protein
MNRSTRRALIAISLVAVAVAAPGWARSRFIPNDTLTDYNVAAEDRPEDVAILRAMQKTLDAEGKPMRRVPGIRIFSLRHASAQGRLPALPSQHVRLKPGAYRIQYACGLGTSQMESFHDVTLSAGRRYYIYCESRNTNQYELKVTEVP